MKIGLFLDWHWGVKNDAKHFLDYQERVLNEVFFPAMEKNNVKNVFIFGDLFDRRKYSNHETLYRAKHIMFDEFEKRGIQIDAIPGNHDCALKNSNKINSLELFLSQYKNINQIHQPTHKTYDGIKFLFLPWICSDDYNSTMEFIKNSDANIVISHLELSGFLVAGEMTTQYGMNPDLFKHFDQVWSGHYHLKSSRDNIKYLGTAIEHSWADSGQDKGFYIFDTETKEIEFILNPYKLHEKVFYDDTNQEFLEYMKNIDINYFNGKNVKLFVQNKTNKDLFEKFVEKMYKMDLIEFQIIEDISEFHELNVETTIDATTSTGTLIEQYVDNVDTVMDKPRIKSMMNKLYLEALMENNE